MKNIITGKQIAAGALLLMLAANPLEAHAATLDLAAENTAVETVVEDEAAVEEAAETVETVEAEASETTEAVSEETEAAEEADSADEAGEAAAEGEEAVEAAEEEQEAVVVKPAKVKKLKAVKVAKTSIKMKWAKVENAEGYEVYRKAEGGSWKKLETVSASKTKLSDTKLNEEKVYYYKVKAFVKTEDAKLYGKFSKTLKKEVIETQGEKVVKFANQFVGNRYVWGGNSLTNGCDCSGFVVQVYAHFGVDLSRTRNSRALRSVGKSVALKDIQKGDIVCYPHHVAIYNGDGKIVEAQSSRAGITNSRGLRPAQVITVRRVVE